MPSMFGGVPLEEAPAQGGSRFGGIPVNDDAAPQQSFGQEMAGNFKQGVQNLKDVASGNFEDIGAGRLTPKTEALGDKLLQGNTDSSAFGVARSALSNIGNTSPSDFAGALLEKFNATPEGKLVGAIGGINPVYNAVGTAVNRYVNPEIQKLTGASPDTIQLMELASAPLGLKKAGEISDPTISALKALVPEKQPPSYTHAEMKAAATAAYDNSEKIGGALPIQEVRQKVQDFSNSKDIGQQTTRGKAFIGNNPVTQTLADLDTATKSGDPWTIQDANEIDDAIRNRITQARSSGDYDSARKLGIIKSGLRDTYKDYAQQNPNQAAGFNEWIRGDKLYSAGSAAEEIQGILDNAERADVPSTAIKNGFKTFVKNDDNKIGLTDDEWAAAEHAAKHGVVTGALKTIGSRLGGHIVGSVAGVAGGGLPGATLGYLAGNAVTAPFRWAANARQAGRGQDVINAISQRPEVQKALNPNYNAPSPTSSPSGFTPSGSLAAPALATGALGNLGDKNINMLQQLKQNMPQQPQSNAAPDIEKFAKAESSNNPNAKNPNSTASGLYQFTNKTWADMVNKYGKQVGITLQDKNNPQAQAYLTKKLAEDNAQSLTKTLGRAPNIGELYMAHVLGATGAAKLINADPAKQAVLLFPQQVLNANRSIFFNGKQPRTVAEVQQLLSKKVS